MLKVDLKETSEETLETKLSQFLFTDSITTTWPVTCGDVLWVAIPAPGPDTYDHPEPAMSEGSS